MINVLMVKSRSQSILSQGVESLLSGMANVHLQRLAEHNQGNWMHILETFRPEVIILFEGPHSRGRHQLEMALFESEMLAHILLISEVENRMYLIEKQAVKINTISDFFCLISPADNCLAENRQAYSRPIESLGGIAE
jgi:hypothetical protein